MKSRKKLTSLFECDVCGYTKPIIIDGKDVFFKQSEIKARPSKEKILK